MKISANPPWKQTIVAAFFALALLSAPCLNAQAIEWIRQFGGAGPANDSASAVDADGNIYVAGGAFLRKYDSAGNELWTRQFGNSASGVAVDSSGIYVVANPSVRKFDSEGNELWTRQFVTGSTALRVTADASGVYVAGQTFGTLPGQTSAGSSDAFVRKYDPDGNELWTRQFGSSTGDLARSVAVDAGGVFVAGGTAGSLPGQTSAGSVDAFVRKYDSEGNELWTRQFGTSSSEQAFGVTVDSNGVYVVGLAGGTFPGQTSFGVSDAFVRKYDSEGNDLWTRQFGTSSERRAQPAGVCSLCR